MNVENEGERYHCDTIIPLGILKDKADIQSEKNNVAGEVTKTWLLAMNV